MNPNTVTDDGWYAVFASVDALLVAVMLLLGLLLIVRAFGKAWKAASPDSKPCCGANCGCQTSGLSQKVKMK